MENYEINNSTLAVIALNEKQSKIIELDEIYVVEKSVFEIIDHSCKFFGSSYLGRHEGTKMITGIKYKTPILIEESHNIIFFPTCSSKMNNCMWISLNNIKNYSKYKRISKIIFKNDYELILNISYGSLENQILRSTLLDSTLRNHKKNIMNK